MPIIYRKLFDIFEEENVTTYKIRQEKLMGQYTLMNLKKCVMGLDIKTLDRLCEYLGRQPGDFMEYVTLQELETILSPEDFEFYKNKMKK